MTQSCRHFSPALAPILLALLLGGEWGRVCTWSSAPPLHSPWTLLHPPSSWDEETEVLSGEGEGGYTLHPVGTSGLAAPGQEDRTRPLPSLGDKQ